MSITTVASNMVQLLHIYDGDMAKDMYEVTPHQKISKLVRYKRKFQDQITELNFFIALVEAFEKLPIKAVIWWIILLSYTWTYTV